MVLNKDVFVEKLYGIEVKKKQIEALNQQRVDEEKALAIEYKVDEVNAKRKVVVSNYQDKTVLIQQEIKNIEGTLGD